ncbi:hypothetical protein OESDEN_00836 [Oesophagostomum dentatum]|uniref:Uncharacterized protein n=1 Tax=Oesophagostomum dentatum TaxID=61180 RepID=A0A0B1TPL9_OESDE|nr:hypothetical protein OESDEN_00836 [Oesophagostomum dentatum]
MRNSTDQTWTHSLPNSDNAWLRSSSPIMNKRRVTDDLLPQLLHLVQCPAMGYAPL